MVKKSDSPKSSKPIAIVAGNSDFIGLSLCDALLLQDLEVYLIDLKLSDYAERNHPLINSSNFHFLEADLANYRFDPVLKPAYIFHLTAEEEALNDQKLGLRSLLVHSLGTKNLLELALSSQAKFILVSGIDIYSGFLSQFNLEYYFGRKKTDQIRFSLQEAKRYAEALTFEYYQQFNLDARIVRLADVYGPGMSFAVNSPISRIFHNVAFYEPITISGDGLFPVRPTYITDVIYGLIKAVVNEDTKGKIYSLANPEEINLLNLAYLVREACQNDLMITFSKSEEVDKHLTVDRAALVRTQTELGWRPKVKVRDGVFRTVEWIRRGGPIMPTKEEKASWREAAPRPISTPPELPVFSQPEEELRLKTVLSAGIKPKIEKSPLTEEGLIKRKKVEPPDEEKNQLPSEKPPSLKIKSSVPIGLREEKPKLRPRLGLKLSKLKSSLPSRPKVSLPRLRLRRPQIKVFSGRSLILVLSLLVVGGIGAGPPFIFAGSSLIGVYRLQNSIKALGNRQVDLAEKESNLAQRDFQRAENWLSQSTWLATMIKKREDIERWRTLTVSVKEVSIATNHLAKAALPAFKMVKAILGNSGESVEEKLRLVKVETDLADDHLALAEGELKLIDPTWYPGLLTEPVKKLSKEVGKTREELAWFREFLQLSPQIFATTDQKTYLLLLQNNMELRPGGGFIGSFGLLKFVNGQMVDLKIEDVYSADGQLKTPVSPPEPIKTYLKQPNWYLRDSNWSPHFPTNAAQAQWFIKNEIGVEPDGVVAIDLSYVKELLNVIGPVDLPDYQDTVSADQLFEKAQARVEADFFPGSSQKRDFIGALARAVIQKMVNSDEGIWPAVIKRSGQAIQQKHLLVYFTDPNLNRVLEKRHWSGTIPLDREVVTGNQFHDFLMVVDANLGANKANYFVRRSVFHQVVVDKDGYLAERVTVEYDNQSPAETWPGGTYTNYLRIYAASGAVLQDVRIDNRTVPDEVQRGRELGKTVWALPIIVPIKSKLTISFDYHLSEPLAFEGGLAAYELRVWKQPGTIDDRFRLTVNYPAFYQVLKSEPKGEAQDQGVVFSTTLDQDQTFRLEIIK